MITHDDSTDNTDNTFNKVWYIAVLVITQDNTDNSLVVLSVHHTSTPITHDNTR